MPDETPIRTFERALTESAGRPAPATQPPEVSAVWAFTGVEVALAREAVPQRSLGRVWKDRRGGRGVPLLVVAPSDGGAAGRVTVVGPSAEQAVRDIDATTLAVEISRLRNEPPQRAARALDESLGRLAAESVPGVSVRGLLTDHYVKSRLPRHPRLLELREPLEAAAAPAAGKREWRGLLEGLGYTLADHRGERYIARLGDRPVALIHPYRDPVLFSRIDEQGRLPEGKLISECQAEGYRWGVMASGSRIRLFEAQTDRGAATERWIDLDLATLPAEHRHLVGLLSPTALGDGLWPRLIEDARSFGAELKDRLDDQIRKHALPAIARGLGESVARSGRSLSDPDTRRDIQQATYTLLFRLLFIFYAESAGHLPIGRSPAYTDNALYTIARRSREIRDRTRGGHTLWDRLQTLTKAIRDGSTSMDLPQYNGSLFAPDDLPGARLIEDAEVSDVYLAPALDALAFDYDGDDDAGLDYTDLDISHIGSIYEGLLALRLSLADQTYAWDGKKDRFVPHDDPGDYGVEQGQLFFQTEAGGRKGGGVYYTRQEFVRHLVNHSVVPALDEHLEQVRKLAASDAEAATGLLFRFRVLDPAMGSGHFLVDALDVIAERVQGFLAGTPLPPLRRRLQDLRGEARAGEFEADDAQLLKRLLLKHCIYGVDLQEMAVELARVALWLSSFVPGLALSYLDQNLKRGDSLVGLGSVEMLGSTSGGRGATAWMWSRSGGPLDEAIRRAGELATQLADLSDRTRDEVLESKRLEAAITEATAGARVALDLWAAESFGVRGARAALMNGDQIVAGEIPPDLTAVVRDASVEAGRRHFFHWPIEFPAVFHRGSERNPGFDAVIGNPPWDEITVEELAFYALHDPGLRGLTARAEQDRRIAALKERFPHLPEEFERRQLETAAQRAFFRPENGYVQQGGGDADLYQLFCERYAALTRSGGRLGVVLPRSTFLAAGGRGFRRWLFRECRPTRLDTILNNRSWAFPIHPQWTLVLLTAETGRRQKGGVLTLTGPSASEQEFHANIGGSGVTLALDDLAGWTPSPADDPSTEPSWELPLLPTQPHARLLGRMRSGPRFDRWALEHGGIFPATEFHETQQRGYFQQKSGVAVWKGRSFDQYDPHGNEPAGFGNWQKILDFVQGKRTAARSNFAGKFPPDVLADPSTHPIHRARVAFRDVTNRTNSRTTIACLVPPRTPLTNKAPYLVFPSGDPAEEAYVLGVFNSLPFDWQARRFVETNMNFFILNLLCFPPDDAADIEGISKRAAQLSCPDERFAEFAKAMKVKVGPLDDDEFDGVRAEIDALVAIAYGLDAADLETVFEDFTLNAVPETYRALVRAKFAEFSTQRAQRAGR